MSDKDYLVYAINRELSLEIGKAIKAQNGECSRNARQAFFLLDGAIYTEGLVFSDGCYVCGHSWLTVDGKIIDPTIFAWKKLADNYLPDGYLPLVMSKELPLSNLASWDINTLHEFDCVRHWGAYWSQAYNIGQEFGIPTSENLDDLRCYDVYRRE